MNDAELDRALAALPAPDLSPEASARLLARAQRLLRERAEEARSPWRRAWRRTWDAVEPWAASAAVAIMLAWAVGVVRPALDPAARPAPPSDRR
ncbi:MAG: hypothetical protein QM704_07740 [Anaeromyxobacteraceae bacterium]